MNEQGIGKKYVVCGWGQLVKVLQFWLLLPLVLSERINTKHFLNFPLKNKCDRRFWVYLFIYPPEGFGENTLVGPTFASQNIIVPLLLSKPMTQVKHMRGKF